MTNGAGAYGMGISEHVIMTTLMLLRRMPEYTEIVRRREWIRNLPVRSIFGSRVTVLGTGDVGSNVGRRMKAMGAAKVVGVSRSGRAAEDFDEVRPIAELDGVLPETLPYPYRAADEDVPGGANDGDSV